MSKETPGCDNVHYRDTLNHEMSTKSRGSILPIERGSMIGKHANEGVPGMPVGMEARNAFELPDDYRDCAGDDTTHHSIYPPEGL